MEVVSALDAGRWSWDRAEVTVEPHLGRESLAVSSTLDHEAVATVLGADLEDGVIEVDVAIAAGRSFHGVAWRVQGGDRYESFDLRSHQNGNPDAIQYTPVINEMAAWQLYHGDGFWNAVEFPVDEWLTIRVEFEGQAAAMSLDGEQVLHTRLRQPARAGAFGAVRPRWGTARRGAAVRGGGDRPPGSRRPRRPRRRRRVGRLGAVRRGRRAGDARAGRSHVDDARCRALRADEPRASARGLRREEHRVRQDDDRVRPPPAAAARRSGSATGSSSS